MNLIPVLARTNQFNFQIKDSLGAYLTQLDCKSGGYDIILWKSSFKIKTTLKFQNCSLENRVCFKNKSFLGMESLYNTSLNCGTLSWCGSFRWSFSRHFDSSVFQCYGFLMNIIHIVLSTINTKISLC